MYLFFFFFFQAEDGIRDYKVTGVQTCALPICRRRVRLNAGSAGFHKAPTRSPARPIAIRSSGGPVPGDDVLLWVVDIRYTESSGSPISPSDAISGGCPACWRTLQQARAA